MFGKQPEGWRRLGGPLSRGGRSRRLFVDRPTWLSTITKPRRHLIATLGVWAWFIAAFVGGGLLPYVAPVLEVTAVMGVAGWYVAMMRGYRSALRRSDGP
ncbi:hypothetical protein [Microbacterium sp. NPDC077057]|uniref:hypothetical protein n=1 Tax=unclassified Microbacterium TaxID=2609290 RepID=UPI003430E77D